MTKEKPKTEWLVIATLLTISTCVIYIGFVLTDYEERIENIECSLGLKDCGLFPIIFSQPDPLEGWKEECINSTTIEHEEFKVMGDTIWKCVSYYNEDYCYEEVKKWNFRDMLSMRVRYDDCFEEREESFDKFVAESSDIEINDFLDSIGCYEQFIERWNETICIKKILVKGD